MKHGQTWFMVHVCLFFTFLSNKLHWFSLYEPTTKYNKYFKSVKYNLATLTCILRVKLCIRSNTMPHKKKPQSAKQTEPRGRNAAGTKCACYTVANLRVWPWPPKPNRLIIRYLAVDEPTSFNPLIISRTFHTFQRTSCGQQESEWPVDFLHCASGDSQNGEHACMNRLCTCWVRECTYGSITTWFVLKCESVHMCIQCKCSCNSIACMHLYTIEAVQVLFAFVYTLTQLSQSLSIRNCFPKGCIVTWWIKVNCSCVTRCTSLCNQVCRQNWTDLSSDCLVLIETRPWTVARSLPTPASHTHTYHEHTLHCWYDVIVCTHRKCLIKSGSHAPLEQKESLNQAWRNTGLKCLNNNITVRLAIRRIRNTDLDSKPFLKGKHGFKITLNG